MNEQMNNQPVEQPKAKTRVGLIVLFSCIALFVGLILGGLGTAIIGGGIFAFSSKNEIEKKGNEAFEMIKEGSEKIKEQAEENAKKAKEKAEESKEKAEEEKNKVDNIINSQTIKAEDQYVVSTYGDELIVYMINNGKLYYKYSKDKIAGLNVCPSSEQYCTDNSKYNNKMEAVTGIANNVVKVKHTVKVNAQGETFIFFAIDSKGDVYELNKTTATKFLEDKKVVDLVSVKFDGTNNYYEFSTSTGKNVLKKWVWLQGGNTLGNGEWRVEEKDK